MYEKDKNWLIPIVLLPLITVWVYLVGIYFQAGYFKYFDIDVTFAETLPTYLLIAWMPIVGIGLGSLILYFLSIEIISRWLITNKTIRSIVTTLLTYLGMLLLILVPQKSGLIQDEFVNYELILFAAIIISHIVQKLFWSHIFTEDSIAFFLSKKFGALILLVIIARFSIAYAYNKGYESAEMQTSYRVFGTDPEFAVVFIGSRYLFAMPIDEKRHGLTNKLSIINLDMLKEPLTNKDFGTGTLKIVPSL